MRRLFVLTTILLPAPLAAAGLTISKSVSIVADGVSPAAPKALPGASADETILVVNPVSNGIASIRGVTVVDTIPATLKLRVADLGAGGSGPVEFTDGGLLGLGLAGSGLTFSYTALASSTDGLDFSTDGVTWTYAPVADAAGYDANVRAVRIRLTGTQAVASGFRLRYRVAIK